MRYLRSLGAAAGVAAVCVLEAGLAVIAMPSIAGAEGEPVRLAPAPAIPTADGAPPITPVVRIERVPARPGPLYIWVPAHWAWRGALHGQVWVPGRWVVSARRGHAWVPGHWVAGPAGSAWVEGRWASR